MLVFVKGGADLYAVLISKFSCENEIFLIFLLNNFCGILLGTFM